MRALVPVLLATLLAACQMGSGSVEQRLAGEKPGAPATETPATMTLASGVELFVAEDFSRSRNPRVVVLPFADQRGLDDAIERRRAEYQVTQAFRNRFTGLKYAIIDPADAADALRAAGLDPYRPVPAGRRGEIAAALKADAVLVGDITHFDKLHAGIAGRIAVGAEVRLIDPARDRVLWRARHEARQTVGKVPTSLMDALATALNLAVDLDDKARAALLEEMLADLIEALPRPGTASAAPAAPSLRILSARHSAGERVLKIG
ncbi:MAG: hypothetical protein FJX47_11885, partial [Alphaproteobacteria bacterium]|nr:hypothetical protein [Alphaproteobacteria bacterium]